MIGNRHLARDSFLVLSLLLAATRATADPPPSAANPARPPDYKIAFWYLRSDPLSSLRHQVYDLRKGQYTRAVDDWLRTIQERYPAYEAYIKEFRLRPDSGEREKKQLATAILQEYVAKGGPYGGFALPDGGRSLPNLGRLMRPGGIPERPEPGGRSEVSLYSRGYGFLNSPGANRPPAFLASPWQGTQGIPTPFPYPYVRPHP